MQNNVQLSIDMLKYIFTWAQDHTPKDLALVSKDWNIAIKATLADLYSTYESSVHLNDYVNFANQVTVSTGPDQLLNIQRVKSIFQQFRKHLNQLELPQIPYHMSNLLNLEKIADQIQIKEKEAHNFMEIVAGIPGSDPFIQQVKHLPIVKQTEELKALAKTNKDLKGLYQFFGLT